jgi:hypothetical protein
VPGVLKPLLQLVFEIPDRAVDQPIQNARSSQEIASQAEYAGSIPVIGSALTSREPLRRQRGGSDGWSPPAPSPPPPTVAVASTPRDLRRTRVVDCTPKSAKPLRFRYHVVPQHITLERGCRQIPRSTDRGSLVGDAASLVLPQTQNRRVATPMPTQPISPDPHQRVRRST